MELANTKCAETRRKEIDFLEQLQLEVYDPDATPASTACILYSRCLDRRYVWPTRAPLTVRQLREHFGQSGHTLTVDQCLSYCRRFSLDLDCVCRKSTKFYHLTEDLVSQVADYVKQVLLEQLGQSARLSIWFNACGYHIYTDVRVSLPTHLYLHRIVQARFANAAVVIEVCDKMPLPYSAKVLNVPYQPLMSLQDDDLDANLLMDDQPYCELFGYGSVDQRALTQLVIETRTGVVYCSRLERVVQRSAVPQIPHIESLQKVRRDEYLDTLMAYFKARARPDASAPEPSGIDLRGLQSCYVDRLRVFASRINQQYRNAPEDTDLAHFVSLSVNTFNCAFLQPFVVALQKFLQIEDDDEEMTGILKRLYAAHLDTNVVVARFVKHYTHHTFKMYAMRSDDEILNELHFMIVNGLGPHMSVEQQVDALMWSTLQCAPQDNATAIATTRRGSPERDGMVARTIDAYLTALRRLNVIMYTLSTNMWYILVDRYYKAVSKPDLQFLPQCVLAWLGEVGCDKRLHEKLINNSRMFAADVGKMWVSSPFCFSTYLGVFNSVTGLYSAHTSLLRFDRTREYGIFPLNRGERRYYETLNEDVVALVDTEVRPFVEIIERRMFELFLHVVLAPAMMQLPFGTPIDMHHLVQYIALINEYDDLTPAAFLVEHFPLDPRLVYVLMHIYETRDQCGSFELYEKFCAMSGLHKSATPEEWKAKYAELLSQMTYDESLPTHLEVLRSIEGPHIEGPTDNFIIYIVLLGVCVICCKDYEPFVRSFGILKVPPPRSVHPSYEDFGVDTSVRNYQANIKRSGRLMLGHEMNSVETHLYRSIVSLAMSAYFNPEVTVDLICAMSMIFVTTNLHKKLVLLFGKQNVGKSLITKLLTELTLPHSISVSDFKAAVDRSGITSKNNLVVVNEVELLSPSETKIGTGCDKEAVKVFYSQEYEIRGQQGLVFGATNVHIRFTCDIDRVTADRLYAVHLRGNQRDTKNVYSDLFLMMINRQILRESLQVSESTQLPATAALMYAFYYYKRNSDMHPYLNWAPNSESRRYANQVFLNNNRLYRLLVESELEENEAFKISASKLLELVKRQLSQRENKAFPSMEHFKRKFMETYEVNLNEVDVVPNFQMRGFIEHVKFTMMVVPYEGGIITWDDIEERVEVYTTDEHRMNARNYFYYMYVDYLNRAAGRYEGVRFKTETCDAYSGNELIERFVVDNDTNLATRAL